MDVEEFKRLMRSKHLIDEGFTEAEMQMVFKRVQDDEDAVDAAAGAQDGMSRGVERKTDNFIISLSLFLSLSFLLHLLLLLVL